MKTERTMHRMELPGREIVFALRRSRISRSIKLSIRPDGKILVSAPLAVSSKKIESFIKEHAGWLLEKIAHFEKTNQEKTVKTGNIDYIKKKALARKLIVARTKELSQFYGFKYGTISIRNQKSRWGSCSSSGSLNFNYRLVYLDQSLIDYVIVHELCHLKEMNHSEKFWALVAKQVPNYKVLKRELKKQGGLLF